ncbi:FAD-dependent oxidoreductase [Pectinatus brassicae]|uniref:Succinate dehydrogenase/fumarate reductase flavoprotein subunit n=1 Tax=Pectinatus brassicae TaxID=862415 RepID=A0A840UQ36_9FIRM|nr:FAD-dependent oxidoreductase [Pectinatus brassicae]MBB5336302.1 succinate dehydrogenase/fumarate reductase flavoprotein subunit [Pectinatus brassicae]
MSNNIEKKHEIARRTFLKDSALAVGTAITGSLLLSGCSKNPNDYLREPKPKSEISSDWLGKAPDIPESKINETKTADVVIVGAGVAGLAAARAASENGASVIVVEKAGTWQCRSGQYGTLNNKIQRSMGITFDKNTAILENMKQMGYRSDQRVWNYWAEHSGKDFDWLLEMAPDLNVIEETKLDDIDRNKINLMIMHYPTPAGYNRDEENSPSYPTVMAFLPSQEPIQTRVYNKCKEQGCKFIFSTRAIKLIRPDNKGRVQGVIAQHVNGKYIKLKAKKAVILTAGDYGNNKSMMKHFVPYAMDYVNVFPNRDAKDKPTNTGDGHIMAVWAGAKIEDGPHAPVIHTLGGPMGTDAYFLANAKGDRFVNEDIGGQQLSNAIYRQPQNFAWQILDDKWPEQLQDMGVAHGSVNYCLPASENPKVPADCQWSIGRMGYTSREDFLKTKDLIVAQSLEELAKKLCPKSIQDQKNLLASIKRYNELCHKGHDEDFGKMKKRMFSIETAPFYAGKMVGGAMLVNMGGLTVNPETGNVLDRDYNGIEGLYTAGNTQGGRFLVDYPIVTAGVSHAFALVYGRLVGTVAAKL